MRIRKRVTASKKNRPVKASTRLARARKLRNVSASKRTAKRSIRASRSEIINYLNFNEMTPEQQKQAINVFLDGPAYELYSEEMMIWWNEQSRIDADEFAKKTGIEVDPDKLYWQESSQGPYPKWDLAKVFGEYGDEVNGVEFSFGFYGSLDVDYDDLAIDDGSGWVFYNNTKNLREDGFDDVADIVEDKTSEVQEFIDQIWGLIKDVCTSYPDEEWCVETLEANDYEFQIDEDGDVVKMF